MCAADFSKMSTKKTDAVKWIIDESKYLTSSFKSWKSGIWGNKSCLTICKTCSPRFWGSSLSVIKGTADLLQAGKEKKNFIIWTPLCCSTFMCRQVMCLHWHHRDKSLSPQQDVEVTNREKVREVSQTLWVLSLLPFYMMPSRCDQFKWTSRTRLRASVSALNAFNRAVWLVVLMSKRMLQRGKVSCVKHLTSFTSCIYIASYTHKCCIRLCRLLSPNTWTHKENYDTKWTLPVWRLLILFTSGRFHLTAHVLLSTEQCLVVAA